MKRLFSSVVIALMGCGGSAGQDAGAIDASVDAGLDAAGLDAAGLDAGIWPSLPDCINGVGTRIDHELLQGSGEGGVSYRLWRCYYMQGAGFTGVYRGDAFELVFGGRTYRVLTAGIDYQWTHHNWYDSLTAAHPQAIMRWRVEWQSDTGELRHYVSATDPGGAVLLPETRAD